MIVRPPSIRSSERLPYDRQSTLRTLVRAPFLGSLERSPYDRQSALHTIVKAPSVRSSERLPYDRQSSAVDVSYGSANCCAHAFFGRSISFTLWKITVFRLFRTLKVPNQLTAESESKPAYRRSLRNFGRSVTGDRPLF